MAQRSNYAQFFFQVADRGSEFNDANLQEAARAILKLIPPDSTTVQRLQALFSSEENGGVQNSNPPTVENTFFGSSPSQVLYNLEVSNYDYELFCLINFGNVYSVSNKFI